MASMLFSLTLFAVLLLVRGAWKRWRRDGASLQMWLMIAAALVILANVVIWIVPDQQGKSLATEVR